MKSLMKSLLLTAAIALAYPALAADPAPRPARPDISKEQFLKQAEARFDSMDANKDSKITAEERTARRPARGAGHGAMMPAEMTKEQYMKHAAQRFDTMDANKDGKITAEERRGMRHGKAGMRRGGCGHDARASGPRGACIPQGSAPVSK